MWQFGIKLIDLAKERKWNVLLSVATACTLAGVVWAGNDAHQEAVDKIESNAAQLQEQAKVQVQLVTTLKAMEKHQEVMTQTLQNLNNQVQQVDRTNRDLINTVVDVLKSDRKQGSGS